MRMLPPWMASERRNEYDVRMEERIMPATRQSGIRRGEKINMLSQIISAALQVTDSGKLYNTMQRI